MTDVKSATITRSSPNNTKVPSSSATDDFSLCNDNIPVTNIEESSNKQVLDTPTLKTEEDMSYKLKQVKTNSTNLHQKDVKLYNSVSKDVKLDNTVPKDVKLDNSIPKDVKLDNTVPKDVKLDNSVPKDVKLDNTVPKDVKLDNKVPKDVKPVSKKVVPSDNIPETKQLKLETGLVGTMKKVQFDNQNFCVGFAQKQGDKNYYAKCKLTKEGTCPTEYNASSCIIAPIHVSDVLLKAVLTKL